MRAALATVPVLPRRSRGWSPGPTLDQGSEGACVGFSSAHRLGGSPIRRKVDGELARRIYRAARHVDEWPGEAYEGTSVLAGMKVATTEGWIREYRWIGAGSGTPINDVVDTLGYVGPIVFGLDWPESFMTPRPSGLLEMDLSSIAGGHAICAGALLLRWRDPREGKQATEVVCLQNSWGEAWGAGRYGRPGGFCYLKVADLEQLIARQGEGAVPLEAPLTREAIIG
jgi:hypothetical protein